MQVRSDFAEELVKVEVELYDEAERQKGGSQSFAVDARAGLPFFTIVPPANSTHDSFVVLLRGRDSAGGSIETKSVVKFLKRQTLELQMWLLKGCRDMSCASGQSCAASPTGGVACQLTAMAPTKPLDPGSLDAGIVMESAEPSVSAVRDAAAGMSAQDAAPIGPGGFARGDAGSASDAGIDAGGARDASTQTGSSTADSGAARTDSGSPSSFGPNGDPSAPVLSLAEVACRSAQAGSSPNYNFNGRDLILDYPCGKHEGAQFTVILNLHGNVTSGSKYYVRDLFSAYRELDAQNLIVLTPVSAVTQWGNGDNATDLPYLAALVDFVYSKFAKADLRGVWIAGHSWGSFYASRIYCDAALKDRVRGLLLMSGGLPSTSTTCLSKLSLITTHVMTDTPVDQSNIATQHHCTLPAAGPELLASSIERRYYNGCDSPLVHEDYALNGKALTDPLDSAVVTKILDAIKRSVR